MLEIESGANLSVFALNFKGPGGFDIKNQHDPFGRRIQKTVDGTTTYFLWDGSSLIGEYTATGTRTKRYHYLPGGLSPIQVEDQGSTYDVHLDHLQTPKLLTDSGEGIVWSQTQQAFGEVAVSPSSSVTFDVRFPGQYADGESGLHYNYFRDYDPGLGRYIQQDPIGQEGGLNTYFYANANPAIYVDFLGLRGTVSRTGRSNTSNRIFGPVRYPSIGPDPNDINQDNVIPFPKDVFEDDGLQCKDPKNREPSRKCKFTGLAQVIKQGQ